MADTECQLELQERDWAVLRGLLESRVMTSSHAAAMFFDGRAEAGKKRLQKLKAAGFIGERIRRVNQPSILFLTRKAFLALKGEGILARYPPIPLATLERRSRVSDLTLRHELDVMDVKAAFHVAARDDRRFGIHEFTTWPLLCQFNACVPGGGEVLVKPDGFIRLRVEEPDCGESELAFFLEVDRSSEMLDVLVERGACYLDYYRSGGFALRQGATRADFKDFPFRVLIVLKTAERRNNVAERLLQATPPIFTQVCLSTFAEVTENPSAPVWIRPKEYKEATDGSPFDSSRRRSGFGYSRQTERERFIEKSVNRISILD